MEAIANGENGLSVRNKLNALVEPAYNVKYYGAVGDGVTDDSGAIQAALDASMGNPVFMPAGNYLIKSKLVLNTGEKLIGAGYSTKLIAAPDLNDVAYTPMIEVAATNHSTIIEGLCFIGDLSYQNVYGWHGYASSYGNTVNKCFFEDFSCLPGGAVDPSSSYDNLISNNVFRNCRVSIFLTGTETQYGNVVIGNTIESGVTGIKAEFPHHTIISNNNINVTDEGIFIVGSYQSEGKVSITGNSIVASKYGILLERGDPLYGYCQHFTMIGNNINITANAGVGIYCYGNSTEHNGYHIITGNIIKAYTGGETIKLNYSKYTIISENNLTGATSYYTLSLSYAENCIISGNILRGSSSATGIELLNNCKYNTIISNDISASSCVTFQSGGQVSNVIKNNYFSGTTGVNISSDATLAQGTVIIGNNYNLSNPVTDNGNGTIFKEILPYKWTIATADGTGTGKFLSASNDMEVSSASADYIVCLPLASASIIGAKINGKVAANGFELRVDATQATTVYINNVTNNVEAAIPANSTFEILLVDATHWILKVWAADGTYSAPVPDAI